MGLTDRNRPHCWNGQCEPMAGASARRPAKSVCPGLRGRTGRAVTRPTATASLSGSWRRWIAGRSERSARDTCPETSASRAAELRQSGLSLRAIAVRLGQAPSTNFKGATAQCSSRTWVPAIRCSSARHLPRRARHHRRRVETNDLLGGVVAELLLRRWSPQQVSRHLRHQDS